MHIPTILIVNAQRKLGRMLRTTLANHGYATVQFNTAPQALRTIRTTRPDLILLDVDFPVPQSIDHCREIRGSCDIPIIVLSPSSAKIDKILALDAGADDYIVKPIDRDELLARIRALLRRSSPAQTTSSLFSADGFAVDFERRQVTVRNRKVHLRPKEFHLLKFLIAHQGRAVAYRELSDVIWGPGCAEQMDNLRVIINQLRKKIEPDPDKPRFIQTEFSVGYRFQAQNGDSHAERDSGLQFETRSSQGIEPAPQESVDGNHNARHDQRGCH